MAVDLRRLATESRRTSIQLEQFIDRYTEKLGLSAAQAHILLYILHHSDLGTSLTQMHREFGYAMPSLCGMLKRLQKNGFVQTAACQDRHFTIYHFFPVGFIGYTGRVACRLFACPLHYGLFDVCCPAAGLHHLFVAVPFSVRTNWHCIMGWTARRGIHCVCHIRGVKRCHNKV